MELFKLLFAFFLPFVATFIADEIAYNNKRVNKLRLKGWEWLDRKPFSCSPCLSFWVSLLLCLVSYPLLFVWVEALILPLIIFFINKQYRIYG